MNRLPSERGCGSPVGVQIGLSDQRLPREQSLEFIILIGNWECKCGKLSDCTTVSCAASAADPHRRSARRQGSASPRCGKANQACGDVRDICNTVGLKLKYDVDERSAA
jgi:hypothetical protein